MKQLRRVWPMKKKIDFNEQKCENVPIDVCL